MKKRHPTQPSAFLSSLENKKRARKAIAKMARELDADEALTFLICAATPAFLESFTRPRPRKKA